MARARTHVEAYVFRRNGRRIEHLCLRRAATAKRLPGVWQPVTGKARLLEPALLAAAREVKEETGLEPVRWWALETVTTYFAPESDAVKFLPLFVAEAPRDARVRLSREHDAFAWLGAREFAARVLWESQRRGLAAVTREVLANRALAAALEVTHRLTPPATRARAGAPPRARRAAGRS